MLNVKIIKEIEEERNPNHMNLSNSLSMSIDQKYHRWKSLETHSTSNKRLEDETGEENDTKIVIKRIKEKIKMKNKLEGIKKNLN